MEILRHGHCFIVAGNREFTASISLYVRDSFEPGMMVKFDYKQLDSYGIARVTRVARVARQEIKEANKMTIYKGEIHGLLLARRFLPFVTSHRV